MKSPMKSVSLYAVTFFITNVPNDGFKVRRKMSAPSADKKPLTYNHLSFVYQTLVKHSANFVNLSTFKVLLGVIFNRFVHIFSLLYNFQHNRTYKLLTHGFNLLAQKLNLSLFSSVQTSQIQIRPSTYNHLSSGQTSNQFQFSIFKKPFNM